MKEGKRQSKQEEITEKPQAKEAREKISFDSWISLRMARKSWMRESIGSFFKSLGLSEKEEIKTYDNAFEKF